MASTISVPYAVMYDGGIRESQDSDSGPQATVRFKCLWDDHYQLVRDLVGTVTRAGSAIVRETPFAYPANAQLYCLKIDSVEGFGKLGISRFFPNSWAPRSKAIVTATFSVPYYGVGNEADAFTSINFGASAEFLTLPESTYRFADGTPTNTPIGIIIPQVEVNVRRHKMPYLPIQQIVTTVGKVNNSAFTIGGFPFAAGSLLFIGGPSEFESDTAGSVLRSVEYKFLFRPINWNYYLHPDRTTGFAIVTDGGGDPPYDSADFTILP